MVLHFVAKTHWSSMVVPGTAENLLSWRLVLIVLVEEVECLVEVQPGLCLMKEF